jgi:hypothetical protein
MGQARTPANWWQRLWAPDEGFARRAVLMIIIAALVAVAAIALYASQFSDNATFLTVWGTALMLSGASSLTGGLLAFLFGVPRLAQETNGTPKLASDKYRANTNLEQISDWITKILVGLGLVDLKEIPGQVQRLVTYLEPGLGPSGRAGAFAFGLLAYFSVAGFLVGYMATRIYAEELFTHKVS